MQFFTIWIVTHYEGDAAAVLSDKIFLCAYLFSHDRTIMQRPWRGLRSVSALVHLCTNVRDPRVQNFITKTGNDGRESTPDLCFARPEEIPE